MTTSLPWPRDLLVDAHIEFTGAAEAAFRLRVHNRAPGHLTFQDHHQAVHFDVFRHLNRQASLSFRVTDELRGAA
jgi:hypothetical protein